ncbi:MAG: hypothetical protein KJO88_00520 [Gammaproteobacteria bacterium]|nr:hypothetical protein [Gammaproteobacteria bacterium]NNM14874.1 hypothetical protein [Gammaproteobacteria bacterium]
MNKSHLNKSRLVQVLVVLLLLLLSISIPAVLITISNQSGDEIVILDEEPLNKKQGLPDKQETDDEG